MAYNNLVVTTKSTYRLWDADFMSSVDLSRAEKDIVKSTLNKTQMLDLYGDETYKTVITDEQLQTLRDDPLFYQDV